MNSCIYLDHNATTPIDPDVVAAMEPYLREIFGNPSSAEHEHGHAAAAAVELAREQVATTIGARPPEIIFTSGCTEANNLAIFGVARAHSDKRHIITTKIEHPSILEPARALEREGWRITYVGVDETGRVSPEAIEAAITDDTALVSVMAANNEVGTLQPIQEIGSICSARGVLFHSDLAQICAYDEIDVERDAIHLASLSAHKAYGPKGVGALYVRSRRPKAKLVPMMFGGGQEKSIRPGTLNTAAIVGMGQALKIARLRRKHDSERLRSFCNAFLTDLQSSVSGVRLNGHPLYRLPNNIAMSIEGVEPLALMRRLRGVASFSASSACATDKIQTSPVLIAMYGDVQRARQGFRVSPGRFTTAEEMQQSVRFFVDAITLLQKVAA